MMQRKIIHIDADCFYAAIEMRDDPKLRGIPMAVGGSAERRGVLTTANYEARKFGVRSAMSTAHAMRLCPHLTVVPPQFMKYREASKAMRSIFEEYTEIIEPLSLDEAYLDVTHNKKGNPSATLIAKEIRDKIYQKTGLSASAGISINKFVAKIASDYNKPNGQKTVPPEEVLAFLEALDIRKFHGIGKVTAHKMYELGIFTGLDLKSKTQQFLMEHFGKSGAYYFNVVRGVHSSSVKPNRARKSLAAERTFSNNLSSELFIIEKLSHIAQEVSGRLQRLNIAGKTITLKIKYSDFKLQTRSKTLTYFISTTDVIFEHAKELLFQEGLQNSVRLVGISISNLNSNIKKDVAPEDVTVQLKFEF